MKGVCKGNSDFRECGYLGFIFVTALISCYTFGFCVQKIGGRDIMQQKAIRRRSFLQGSAALFSIVPARLLRAESAPSNQLTRGVIGYGSIARGGHFSSKYSRLIALCDVDAEHLATGIGRAEKDGLGKISAYRDFREIIERPDIDIVHICTPPHWHGIMSIMAARAGKDIWCEKPMTRTIGEGIRVREAVQANSRMFRLNTWFRFQGSFYGMNTEFKPIKKAVENRLLGWPLKVVVGDVTGFSWRFGWSGKTNLEPQPVPAHLDYNMWLGPAPYKPYHPHRVHASFRGYWDYDGGGLGDMGQHYLDPVQYMLEKDDTSPIKVDYEGLPQHPDAVGTFRRITFTYADGCQIILDGDNSLKDVPYVEGPKGKIWKGLRSDIPNFDRIVASLPDPAPQQTDFKDTVVNRRKFTLNEDNGFRSCTMVNLGIVAMRLGRGFAFDPVKLCAVNDEAANRFIWQQAREPWKI